MKECVGVGAEVFLKYGIRLSGYGVLVVVVLAHVEGVVFFNVKIHLHLL